jgi:hypothetical protein
MTANNRLQTAKAAVFANLFASLIEFDFRRHDIQNRESFWFSRLAATTFLPWFMFIPWYVVPAIYGRW